MTDISVLLVTHNHEKYIERAIASIESQLTHRSVEVVVADDRSTDGTLDLLVAWAKRSELSVRVLPTEAHLGITRNYQRGFAACAGEYVAVLEGDDEWIAVDKLERQAAVLDANEHLTMAANRVLLYDDETGASRVIPLIGHDRFLTEVTDHELADSNWFATFSCCMYRSSVLRSLDPAVFETTAYDWLVNMAVMAHGNAGLLGEVMSLYRQHPEGEWSRKKQRDRDLQLQALIPEYARILGPRVAVELARAGLAVDARLNGEAEHATPTIAVVPVRIPRVERAHPPRVSVVMAAYNHGSYVLEAVNSVLSQTVDDLELIVVDDASTDQTLRAIATIDDPRVRVYHLGGNLGGAAALNVAIQQSRASLVAVINSDDAWEPTKLERQLEALDAHPEVGAVFTNARLVGAAGRPLRGRELPAWDGIFRQRNRSQGAWLRQFFEEGSCLCHPSVLIRREYYEKHGLMDNRLRQIPDLSQWITLVKHYPILVLDEELVRFRILPGHGNASSTSDANVIRGVREHLAVNEHFFDDCGDELIRDGFGDLLRNPEFHTPEERACALAFLWLDGQSPMRDVNRIQAQRELRALLAEPATATLLLKQYSFSDLSLHDLARTPDALPRRDRAAWLTGGRPRTADPLGQYASGELLRAVLGRMRRTRPWSWPRRIAANLRIMSRRRR